MYKIMTSLITIALMLLSGLSGTSAPKAVPAESLGAVQYEVRYKLAGITSKVAEATISLENGTRDGLAVLHSHAAIQASSVFRLFMDAEYIADSYMDKERMEPVYYFNPIKKGKKEGKYECIFDSSSKSISSYFLKPPADAVVKSFPLDGLTMDLLSLLVYVRFQDIPAGKSLSMHLLMAGKCVPATLTNQGDDNDRFPGTERFLLKLQEGGLMENGSGNEITVWRSTAKERRILGLETALSSGVMTVSIKD